MKLAKPVLLSFSLLAFASASAYAQDAGKSQSGNPPQSAMPDSSSAGASSGNAAKKEDFSKLDKDGDGSVSRIEAAADADAQSRFEKLDQNQDQKLSQQEYQGSGSASAGAGSAQSGSQDPSASGASGSAAAGASSAQSGQDSQAPQSKEQQSQKGQEQSASGGASQQSQSEMPVSKLIGMKVSDSQGKDLGEIKEVVIDLQSGKAHAAVLEFGGFMGIGDKQFAFPMGELKQGKNKNTLMVNVDKQKLENAEGFAKGQMPGMDDQYWSRVGGQGQASAGGGQQGQKMNLVRASQLEGKEVQDKSGKQVGEIQDVTVDIGSGELKNIVIDVKDAGQAKVQATSLSSGTDDKLVIDMSADQLKSQAKQSSK